MKMACWVGDGEKKHCNNNCECSISDQKQFRNLIVWLEDQKIRHYRIEDREALRNTDSATWADVFSKVSTGCTCFRCRKISRKML